MGLKQTYKDLHTTYSMRRSKSSKMITESGDLKLSMNSFWMWVAFCDSDLPINESTERKRTKGKVDCTARCAASAVFPVMFLPSSSMVSKGVRSEVAT